MRHFLIAILCVVCGQAAASSHAVKPRELVHPYPPSGAAEVTGAVAANKVLRTMQGYVAPAFTDILALHVAQTLRAASDGPVTVTRRHKLAGSDAAAAVSSAAADGRTLLLANSIPPDSLRPVALVARMPYVLIATSNSQHQSLGDLIREARVGPDRVLVASAGERSIGHLAVELLRMRRGLPMEVVAYNGGNAALQAVAAKQVSAALVPLPAVLPYLSGARLKALAIAGPRRHPSIPHVQTSAQAGVADFEATGWFGLFAPAATAQAAIHDLNSRLARGPESDQTQQVFADLGLRLEHGATDAFAVLLARERELGSVLSLHPSPRLGARAGWRESIN